MIIIYSNERFSVGGKLLTLRAARKPMGKRLADLGVITRFLSCLCQQVEKEPRNHRGKTILFCHKNKPPHGLLISTW